MKRLLPTFLSLLLTPTACDGEDHLTVHIVRPSILSVDEEVRCAEIGSQLTCSGSVTVAMSMDTGEFGVPPAEVAVDVRMQLDDRDGAQYDLTHSGALGTDGTFSLQLTGDLPWPCQEGSMLAEVSVTDSEDRAFLQIEMADRRGLPIRIRCL